MQSRTRSLSAQLLCLVALLAILLPAAVLDTYQLQGTGSFVGTTHFAPWSYDRLVPLAFYGAPFPPGEYHGRVAPVDLAATLASLAGVNQPSASVGRVLTEAIKPVKPMQ
ncbi:MAG TPA: hypothetical protein VKF63_09895 [Terracidiphilus sp.]|nr:hypothetical protein [Terracidiphilus sp.]